MNMVSEDSYSDSTTINDITYIDDLKSEESEINESNEDEGKWETLKDHEDYEIFNQEPFPIRKKGSDNLIAETFHKTLRYYCCTLNGKMYYKHRLIATQFISNPNPTKFKYVDHVNHCKTDNRLENLRWCSNIQNTNNRKDQRFLQTIDKIVAIEVKNYNSWQFEDLYFFNDSFVRYNGINYSVLNKRYDKRREYYRTNICDINGKLRTIIFPKFKREFGLI